jgi:prepilin peptidase CpaA
MREAAIVVIFPFCMVFAAVSDMLSMTIANRVSVILAVSFAIVAPLTGMGWTDYAMHLAAGTLVLSVTIALFAIGGMGGGDAKLLAATAIWMGFGMPLMHYLVLSAVAGGALTLAILVYRTSPLAVYTAHNRFLRHFADAQNGIPYGIALGIGGILAFPQSPLMSWALGQMSAL